MRQADVPTNFNPIDPDKKSVSARQPLSALRRAYGSVPLEPAETRPRSNFPESRTQVKNRRNNINA